MILRYLPLFYIKNKFSDYHCIGFDLDSTIIHYNIENLVQLEYNVITKFLIDKKNYDPDIFKHPLTVKDLDFLQKGLIFDLEKGNIVKLDQRGKVQRASHGTTLLSAEEIEKYYPKRHWTLASEYHEKPLATWGQISPKIRALLNCFDISVSFIFAKIVDSIDKKYDGVQNHYEFWPDILEALNFMYRREQLKNNEGNFFSEVKANPGKYIYKCSPDVLSWIKEIKKKQKTFLITGSNSDFVKVTTGYAFGEDLKSLFDIIVCYGQKPGFFTQDRPFYSVKSNFEDAIVSSSELQVGEIYHQGNWKELQEFFSRITNVEKPRCLYVGDDLLQDIYAPSEFTDCDTLVVSDEHLAEKILHRDLLYHNHARIINSNTWGSFFSVKTADGGYEDSFWNYIIKKYSKICVPNLEIFCGKPLDEPIKCFKQEDHDKESNGYYPEKPVTLLKL